MADTYGLGPYVERRARSSRVSRTRQAIAFSCKSNKERSRDSEVMRQKTEPHRERMDL